MRLHNNIVSSLTASAVAALFLSKVALAKAEGHLRVLANDNRRLNHCVHTTEALCSASPIAAPADGQVSLLSGSLAFDESAVYIMSIVADCSYTFTFCDFGGTSSSIGFAEDENHPYIGVSGL